MINHYEWKISKTLNEARTVYIMPARGQGSYVRQILQLLSEGKRVAVRNHNGGWEYYTPDMFGFGR